MWWDEEVIVNSWREKIELKTGFFWKKMVWLYGNNNAEKAILFFHWNWETVNSVSFPEYLKTNFRDYNILVFDYPGYSESSWLPTESNTYESSEYFFDRLIDKKWIKSDSISLRWYSVWTSLAIDLASKRDFDSLVLVSPFTSRYDMTKHYIGFIIQPFLLIRDSLQSQKKIKEIKNKTLIVHWTEDDTVPHKMGMKIFESSTSKNKQIISIKWWWHNILRANSGQLLQYYKNFLYSKNIKNQYVTIK